MIDGKAGQRAKLGETRDDRLGQGAGEAEGQVLQLGTLTEEL